MENKTSHVIIQLNPTFASAFIFSTNVICPYICIKSMPLLTYDVTGAVFSLVPVPNLIYQCLLLICGIFKLCSIEHIKLRVNYGE